MAIWNVKFDHVNGENRKCKLCGDDFYTKKPVWRCKPCIGRVNFETAKQKAGDGLIPTGKWAGLEPKKPYPFDNRNSEASNRFSRIRGELRKAWENGRDEVNKHYAKQLKEIEENGILEWILDRRANDDLPNGKEKAKSKKQTNVEYPDTRGHYEY